MVASYVEKTTPLFVKVQKRLAVFETFKPEFVMSVCSLPVVDAVTDPPVDTFANVRSTGV